MKKDKSSSRPNKVQVEVTNSNLQEKKNNPTAQPKVKPENFRVTES